MGKSCIEPAAGALALLSLTGPTGAETPSFNSDRAFARFGPVPDGSQREEPTALEQADFDDSSWRILDVPHDWGIERTFRAEPPNRTGKLPRAGIGWYRKRFHSTDSDNGDPTSHEPFQASEHKVFNGLALVTARSTKGESGFIQLTAQSEGLREATTRIVSRSKTVAELLRERRIAFST